MEIAAATEHVKTLDRLPQQWFFQHVLLPVVKERSPMPGRSVQQKVSLNRKSVLERLNADLDRIRAAGAREVAEQRSGQRGLERPTERS